MKNTTKISITTEKKEVFVIRAEKSAPVLGFCSGCGNETELLTIDEAVSESGFSTIGLVGELERGTIHSIETMSGHLLICQESLADADMSPKFDMDPTSRIES
ncbi:MAG: hypothetical protein R2684_01875 [Pyrinomonadaceae bacterium]